VAVAAVGAGNRQPNLFSMAIGCFELELIFGPSFPGRFENGAKIHF
jgi:hypothetical protein